jgi:hypothetical protein
VAHPVVVVGVGHRVVVGRVEGGGDARRHREPPDGREVGPGRPEQVEAVALGLGQGLLVGQDVALGSRLGQTEGADHPRCGPTRRIGHAIGVEAGFGVGQEEAVLLPAGEEVGGHGVPVAPAAQVRLGQLDQDGIGRVPRGQMGALVRRDDVVGRGDDLGNGGPVGVVTQPPERFESRHRTTLPHRRQGRGGDGPVESSRGRRGSRAHLHRAQRHHLRALGVHPALRLAALRGARADGGGHPAGGARRHRLGRRVRRPALRAGVDAGPTASWSAPR